jgi:hypothetical protein
MKEVRIKQYTLPDKSSVYIKQKQYRVWLGNHATNYFSSEKETLRFLAETNRFLTDCLHELNYLYGIVFQEYRAVWFYAKRDESIESTIMDYFLDADKLMINLTTRGQTTNGNAFVFNWLFAVCDSLTKAVSIILDLHEERKTFADLRRVKTFARQLESIKSALEKYGQ